MSIKQLFFITLVTLLPATLSAHLFTVVLDQGVQHGMADGHKALTVLKQTLEDTFPHVRIVLSQTAQETADPLQSASFSNCIKADLHITFNIFSTASDLQRGSSKEVAKTIRIYTCSTHNAGSDQQHNRQSLALIPARRAHEQHMQASKKNASTFFNAAKNNDSISVYEPTSLPLKPLQVINAPSFLIEIGIGKPKEWKVYFPQLFEGLKEVIMVAIQGL